MNCRVCNEKLEASWTECPCCETTIESVITCSNCEQEIKSHWKKCPNCNTKNIRYAETEKSFERYSSINGTNQFSQNQYTPLLSSFNNLIENYKNGRLKSKTDRLVINNDHKSIYLTGKLSGSDEITFKAIPAIGNNGSIVSLIVNDCFKTPIENRINGAIEYDDYNSEDANVIEEDINKLSESSRNKFSSDADLENGQKLTDKYIIKSKIGCGGFSNVYKAEDIQTGETVALKIMSAFGNSDAVLSFLMNEYNNQLKIKNRNQILKTEAPFKIRHKNLDLVILPMELANKTFRQWLNENKSDDKETLNAGLDIISQICMGIDAIHEADLIHMDLKPENILLKENNENKYTVKISDFGLSRSLDKLSGINHNLMQDGIGTPAYMSPEQIFAARWKDVTKSADIYAVGAMLYELLDGDLPYSGSSAQIKEKKRDKEIKITPPNGPRIYVNIAMQCLEREIKLRPRSGQVIIEKIAKGNFPERSSNSDLKEFKYTKRTQKEIEEILGEKLNEHNYLPEMIDTGNFKIGKYPITFKQYDYYCEKNGLPKPSDEGWGRENRPVINVSWSDAAKYCTWLNQITGRSFRLPTDKEWEFAAKCGQNNSMLRYSGSNNLNEVGWYQDNSYKMTQPVGKKKANKLNIFDMTGNTWEWCDDWYDNDKTLKIIRGGAWNSFINLCSVNLRYWNNPEQGINMISFRILEDTQWCF